MAGVPGGDPQQLIVRGAVVETNWLELSVKDRDLAVKRADASGDHFEGELRRVHRRARVRGTKACADRETGTQRFADQDLLAQLLRSGRDQISRLQLMAAVRAFTAP